MFEIPTATGSESSIVVRATKEIFIFMYLQNCSTSVASEQDLMQPIRVDAFQEFLLGTPVVRGWQTRWFWKC
jgi:hypothetical protein